MNNQCPKPIALSQALTQGEQSPLYSHITSCPTCSQAAQLAMLGRELPRYTPSARQKEQVLSGLLAAAQITPTHSKTSSLWWMLPVAASLALFGFFLWPRSGAPIEPPQMYSSISGQASYQSSFDAKQESLVVQEGKLQIDARKLPPGKRLTVDTNNATIETLYSVFTIAAYQGDLIQVDVQEGQLTLTLRSKESLQLSANSRWEPSSEPIPEPPPTETASKNPKAGTQPASSTKPTTTPLLPKEIDPAELAYQEGVSALKENNLTLAEEKFLLASTAKEPSLKEDALFWYTVTLLRAKKDQEAKGALQRFISQYPGSTRIGESRVALGWLFVESGDLRGAEEQFTAAKDDRSNAVRQSALKGLDAVAPK